MRNSEISQLSLKAVALSCAHGSCPTVYETNRGTVMVQGYIVTSGDLRAAGLDVPAGEQLVEIPLTLLADAARVVEQP